MSVDGYTVNGPCRDLIGSLQGRSVIVAGSGESVFDDLRAIPWRQDAIIFACNDIGMYLPVVHHWFSLHADKLQHWVAARRCDGSLWQEFRTHTSFSALGRADYVWTIEPSTFPLSGTFAMQCAYIMGADRIVLAGCPGSPMRRFFDSQARSDYGYGGGDSHGDSRDRRQFLNEMARVPAMRAKVTSMSGWHKEYFNGSIR